MKFPEQAARACDELYGKYRELAHGSDADRRRLTRMIAEQTAWAIGDWDEARRWGCKKRKGVSDDYQSKDSIAYLEPDGSISVWDWQNGSTRERMVNEGDAPTHAHLSPDEADFMEVAPRNHLGWGDEPPPPPPPDQELLEVLAFIREVRLFLPDVRASLGRLEGNINRLEGEINLLKNQPPPELVYPTYKGTMSIPMFGERPIKLEPQS